MDLSHAFRLQSKEIVALVGGGGKSTAMFRLAAELAAQGKRVVTTTTTRIFAAQVDLAPQHLVYSHDQPIDGLLSRLAQALTVQPHVLVVGLPDRQAGKVFGVEPAVVEAIAGLPEVDIILVEADGSRMRPFKAPAEHEPAVPVCTTLLVPVVGIDALGRPLTDEHIHRAERAAALAEVQPGVAVTPEVIAAVLAHPQGGLKGLPPGARAVPLVNKVESAEEVAAARALAGRLLAYPGIDSVVVGAAERADPAAEVHSRVAAVVLAAGGAERFGAAKQLLPWAGGTLLSRAVDTALASQASPVVVVLGHQADAGRAALGDRPAAVVYNADWAQGQSTSVKAGLAALPANVGAALFLLVDQPGVTPAIVDALIERHRATLAPVVWPEYEGRRGNPVLFDRVTFPALMRLSGDVGGRPVLQAYAGHAGRVPVADSGVLFDIDTPGDYEQAVGQKGSVTGWR